MTQKLVKTCSHKYKIKLYKTSYIDHHMLKYKKCFVLILYYTEIKYYVTCILICSYTLVPDLQNYQWQDNSVLQILTPHTLTHPHPKPTSSTSPFYAHNTPTATLTHSHTQTHSKCYHCTHIIHLKAIRKSFNTTTLKRNLQNNKMNGK